MQTCKIFLYFMIEYIIYGKLKGIGFYEKEEMDFYNFNYNIIYNMDNLYAFYYFRTYRKYKS